jgi:hypothetical protein
MQRMTAAVLELAEMRPPAKQPAERHFSYKGFGISQETFGGEKHAARMEGILLL